MLVQRTYVDGKMWGKDGNQNMLDTEELDRLVDTILDSVLYFCNNISGDDTLTCLENHYDLEHFVDDDWYLGDTEEERQKNNALLENEKAYEYVANRYPDKLEEIIAELREKYGNKDEDEEYEEYEEEDEDE